VNKKRDSQALLKARNYAFLLLKFRLRSEKEMRERLKRKNFDQGIIKETLSFLKSKSFIDDSIFAREWIEARLKKPLGILRLRQELGLKGIDEKIIDSALLQIKEDYSEQVIVKALALARLAKLKDLEPNKAKQRIYGYLLRRGFSPEVVIDTIKQL